MPELQLLPGPRLVYKSWVYDDEKGDQRVQGMKLSASLLQDAVKRAVVVSQNAGVRALLVHALHDRAKPFYEHYGFQVAPVNQMTLMLRLGPVVP